MLQVQPEMVAGRASLTRWPNITRDGAPSRIEVGGLTQERFESAVSQQFARVTLVASLPIADQPIPMRDVLRFREQEQQDAFERESCAVADIAADSPPATQRKP